MVGDTCTIEPGDFPTSPCCIACLQKDKRAGDRCFGCFCFGEARGTLWRISSPRTTLSYHHKTPASFTAHTIQRQHRPFQGLTKIVYTKGDPSGADAFLETFRIKYSPQGFSSSFHVCGSFRCFSKKVRSITRITKTVAIPHQTQ